MAFLVHAIKMPLDDTHRITAMLRVTRTETNEISERIEALHFPFIPRSFTLLYSLKSRTAFY